MYERSHKNSAWFRRYFALKVEICKYLKKCSHTCAYANFALSYLQVDVEFDSFTLQPLKINMKNTTVKFDHCLTCFRTPGIFYAILYFWNPKNGS